MLEECFNCITDSVLLRRGWHQFEVLTFIKVSQIVSFLARNTQIMIIF